VIFTFKNWYDILAALRSMFTIGSEEQESTQLPELSVDPKLLHHSNFCNRYGDSEHTGFSGKCKKDKIKFCGFCGSPQHEVFNCNYQARSIHFPANLAISQTTSVLYDEGRIVFS
jgi:hypothetical protein